MPSNGVDGPRGQSAYAVFLPYLKQVRRSSGSNRVGTYSQIYFKSHSLFFSHSLISVFTSSSMSSVAKLPPSGETLTMP